LPTGRELGTCVSRRALVRSQQHGVKMGPEINCKGEELIKVIKISAKESYMRLSYGRLRLIRCKISYVGELIYSTKARSNGYYAGRASSKKTRSFIVG
jgi:hypothetical protein